MLLGFQYSYQRRKLYASDMLILGIKRSIAFLRHESVLLVFLCGISGAIFGPLILSFGKFLIFVYWNLQQDRFINLLHHILFCMELLVSY